MSTIIACGCPHDGPDRMQCGATTAIGTPIPCSCDCHAATHVVVTLNRAEVEAAVADLFTDGFGKKADRLQLVTDRVLGGWSERAVVDRLCKRWGIDR